MHKKWILVLIFFVSILINGCANLNPLNDPGEKVIQQEQSSEDRYMEKVDDELDSKQAMIEEDSEEFSNKLENVTKSIYYNALDKYTQPSQNDSDDSLATSLLKDFYSTYKKICLAAPWIVIISVVLGVFGAVLSRHNKGSRRFFIWAFIIIMPLLVVFIVFGVGILNGLFLNQ